ncbi:hypothetical protein P3553_25135, partial [Vibrio parahaemolyticus]|nr:hypothetical protein [Vibrio parahaemolyticus]MDG2687684.1 hypothetical protein [Vibrio parahaemolyticus]MDG3399421.1 hypothetical protein [Vibrio parahaemolyticus]
RQETQKCGYVSGCVYLLVAYPHFLWELDIYKQKLRSSGGAEVVHRVIHISVLDNKNPTKRQGIVIMF